MYLKYLTTFPIKDTKPNFVPLAAQVLICFLFTNLPVTQITTVAIFISSNHGLSVQTNIYELSLKNQNSPTLF